MTSLFCDFEGLVVMDGPDIFEEGRITRWSDDIVAVLSASGWGEAFRYVAREEGYSMACWKRL